MEEASMLKHFSHQHPLEYVESRSDEKRVCSACKLAIMPRNSFYHCKICRFSLHKVCCSMPKKVMHPCDPNHCLDLSTSSLAEKSNECEACGRYIDGFYYSCNKCSLYCHMLCVAMPLSVKITSSHPHVLKLELEPLYDFKCDICDKPSYNGWHYHCRICEFDAHVSCAVKGGGGSLLKEDRIDESKSHQHELMELLSEGMKHVEAKNANNLGLDQDHDHDHRLRHPDQSFTVSEAFTLPSCQFSDACFSLDISNTVPSERETHWTVCDSKQSNEKLQLLNRQSFSFGVKELKREVTLPPSTGIRTPVWDELGRGNENRNTNATNDRMPFKDQTRDAEIVNLRRPFWSKLLMCF